MAANSTTLFCRSMPWFWFRRRFGYGQNQNRKVSDTDRSIECTNEFEQRVHHIPKIHRTFLRAVTSINYSIPMNLIGVDEPGWREWRGNNWQIRVIVVCLRKIGLVLAWIIFLVLAYRVSLIETEHKEYDPFAVLNVDRVSNQLSEPCNDLTRASLGSCRKRRSVKSNVPIVIWARSTIRIVVVMLSNSWVIRSRDERRGLVMCSRKKLPKLTRRSPTKKRKKTGKNTATLMDREVERMMEEEKSFPHTRDHLCFSHAFRHCSSEMASWSSELAFRSVGLCRHLHDCPSRHCRT